MKRSAIVLFCSFVVCALLATGSSWAQTFPVKPVRIVVPNPPGGGTDTMARAVAEKVAPALGQQIIVDNRAGGGGRIAAELVARSAKDGYTLLQGSNTALITGPAMYSKLSYDPLKDFTPVALTATTAYILAAHPSVPARSVREVLALVRTRKGSLTYGSTGPGSSAHLGMALVEAMTGTQFIHVPYKGSSPAMLALVQGEIDIMFGNYQATLALIRANRLRALGVSSAKRSTLVPEIPTIAESGLAGFDMQQYYSLVAPAGTPGPVIQRLNQEIARHLPAEDVKKRLSHEGIEIVVSTPEEFGKLMASEIAKWTKIIRAAGVKVD